MNKSFDYSKELIGASSSALILSILRQGESYGYEIIQKVKAASDGTLNWNEGSLYPVLHKLKAKGFITSEWKVSENGRKRKYYKLSQNGKLELNKQVDHWNFLNNIINNLWNNEPTLA